MKRASNVFRLKKNQKKLESEDYTPNLKLYLWCTQSVQTITLYAISEIPTGLNAARKTTRGQK